MGWGCWVLSRSADTDWPTFAATLATAAVAFTTKLNPLWLLAVAAGLGLIGLS